MSVMQKYRNHASFFQLHGTGHTNLTFDNSGENDVGLSLPGFDGMPLYVEIPPEQRFAHGFGDWAQNRLTALEMEMLRLMNAITDLPTWYDDILDADRWTEICLHQAASYDIGIAGWEWCLRESRDKADEYRKEKIVHVLDSASRVCKSDVLVLRGDALVELAAAVNDTRDSPVVVDPDMYPLIWGETRVLSAGGHVSVEGAVDSTGLGDVTYQQVWKCSKHRTECHFDGLNRRTPQDCLDPTQRKHRKYRFGEHLQWLPCEVSFDGSDERISTEGEVEVKITSYINNLHPQRHPGLYQTIEKCIGASITPWNQVLVYREGWGGARTRHGGNPRWTLTGFSQCAAASCREV